MSADPEDLRPQKRLRTAEDSPSQSSTTTIASGNLNDLKRHEEFWFDDGSVVLIARNTGFRVFRSLLAAQSTIFSDMLSSSSPTAEEMFEGCPVVHVSDSPEDVAHFLHVLLPKSQRTLYARNPRISFRKLSAIIRLAHKYHVQDVLDQAIAALEEYFTSDFDIWERGANLGAVAFNPKHAIGVVNLARLVDRPSLLPLAFYQCVSLGGEVVNGYRREDGSMECLDISDIKRCIDGRNELAAKAAGFISDVFVMHPCARCETPGDCPSALKKILETVICSEDASSSDVLASWEEPIKLWAADFLLCRPCTNATIGREAAKRKRVWNALPDIFDIEVDGWHSGGGDGVNSAATTPTA
ncbi:hypothetical protein LXA43DRAFT_1090956 [Ganoderma leucocontextum]|nr:hypothetical protein LXA43DRAFT_1090956 [Ganoderma leucocontextum]